MTGNGKREPLVNDGVSLPVGLLDVLARYPHVEGYIAALQSPGITAQLRDALSPAHIGFLSRLPFPDRASVLCLDWHSASGSRYLCDQGFKVSMVIDRPDVRLAAQILCQGASHCSIGERVPEVLSGTEKSDTGYNAIIIGPDFSHASDDGSMLDSILAQTLETGGYLCIAEKQEPLGSSMPSLMARLPISEQLFYESVLALPSVECPELLIRESFLHEHPQAWHHLARYINESGEVRLAGSAPIQRVWQTYHKYQDFPLDVVPRFRVVYRRDHWAISPIHFDFLHVSIGNRKPEFWSLAVKGRGREEVSRERTPWGELPYPNANLTFAPPATHTWCSEPYRAGKTLSECLLSALALDPIEVLTEDPFESLIQSYWTFLNENVGRGTECLIDLLPDNLIVDPEDGLLPFDQEWASGAKTFTPAVAFYRGILYFLSRNVLALDRLAHAARFGPTHDDFLSATCRTVGVSPAEAAGECAQFEKIFRELTLEKYGVIGHTTMLKRRFGNQEHVQISCLLEFDSPVHDSLVNIPFAATTAQRHAECEMGFPITGNMPKKITIKTDSTVVGARLHSLRVCATGQSDVHELIRLAGHKKIILAAERLVIDDDASIKDAVESGPIREIAFAIPFEGIPSDSFRGLSVNLAISWPALALDLRSHHLQMKQNWAKEEALVATQAELGSTVDQLRTRTAELDLLKSSKAWRLAEFLRRIIYRFIRPPNSGLAQPPSAVEQLQRPTSAPRERLASALHEEIKGFESVALAVSNDPIISVVMPVHNTPKAWLADAVGSVSAQTYPHWQLVIVNDGSTKLETREFLDRIDDPRVTVFPLTRGVGISAATCMGIDASQGEYLAFMDHDDMLAPQALQKVAEKVREKNPDVLYTDESAFSDETEAKVNGYFGVPHLKPDFSPDLLLCHNYITHLLVVRKSLVDVVGGPRSEFDGAQDFDFLLRLTEKTNKIEHIAEPLYYWRQSSQSTSLDTGAKPQAHSRGARALTNALDRRGIEGEVLTANAPHFFRVRRRIAGDPSVAIIIPFRDQPRLLQKCLSSILARTRYANFQILGIDNGSVDQLTLEIKDHFETANDRVAFLNWERPFNFAEIVNFGVSQSPTDHVVLMNNDIEIINNDWLDSSLEHSQRPEIGAVGGKLFYPDDTIQHAGIIVGIGGYAGHSHKHKAGGDRGYLNRLNLVQNVSAVTGALMMVKTDLFRQVGGFDADKFGVACNDVDFCLRLMELGYRNIFTPYTKAYHFESVSRGYEDTPEKKARFEREVEAFRERHAAVLAAGDPYYNPNLRLDVEDFSIRARPES